MAVQNSPIAAAGIGKNAKRHDLKGTPGLSEGSDLQYGDVQKLEAGQQALSNVKRAPAASGAAPQTGQAQAPMQVPDPVSFAVQKIGGGQPAVPTELTQTLDMTGFLPLARQLAVSDASPLLKKAYIKMLSSAQRQPINGGGTVLVDRQEFDRAAEEAF